MNWSSITKIKKLNREEIQRAVKSKVWQNFRKILKGKTLKEKHDLLGWWYERSIDKEIARIQITNYINALKRGGLIK